MTLRSLRKRVATGTGNHMLLIFHLKEGKEKRVEGGLNPVDGGTLIAKTCHVSDV